MKEIAYVTKKAVQKFGWWYCFQKYKFELCHLYLKTVTMNKIQQLPRYANTVIIYHGISDNNGFIPYGCLGTYLRSGKQWTPGKMPLFSFIRLKVKVKKQASCGRYKQQLRLHKELLGWLHFAEGFYLHSNSMLSFSNECTNEYCLFLIHIYKVTF